MIALLQALQLISGALWLVPAVYLLPRILAAWRHDVTRTQVLSVPIGFLCWLMVGFVVPWIVWPHALDEMSPSELTTWTSLYGLSCLCAVWIFHGAIQTRGQ